MCYTLQNAYKKIHSRSVKHFLNNSPSLVLSAAASVPKCVRDAISEKVAIKRSESDKCIRLFIEDIMSNKQFEIDSAAGSVNQREPDKSLLQELTTVLSLSISSL